jgi:hypothetical protein
LTTHAFPTTRIARTHRSTRSDVLVAVESHADMSPTGPSSRESLERISSRRYLWGVGAFGCLVLLVLSLASVTALARPDRRSADVNVVLVMQHGHTLANSTASPEFDSGMNAAPESDSGTSSFTVSRRSRACDNLQRFKTEVAHSIIWLIRMDSKVKS